MKKVILTIMLAVITASVNAHSVTTEYDDVFKTANDLVSGKTERLLSIEDFNDSINNLVETLKELREKEESKCNVIKFCDGITEYRGNNCIPKILNTLKSLKDINYTKYETLYNKKCKLARARLDAERRYNDETSELLEQGEDFNICYHCRECNKNTQFDKEGNKKEWICELDKFIFDPVGINYDKEYAYYYTRFIKKELSYEETEPENVRGFWITKNPIIYKQCTSSKRRIWFYTCDECKAKHNINTTEFTNINRRRGKNGLCSNCLLEGSTEEKGKEASILQQSQS